MDWHIPAIEDHCIKFNCEKFFSTDSRLYIYSKGKALDLEVNLPPNFSVRALTEDLIPQINENYPNRNNKTPYLFKKLLTYNLALGLFNGEGKLLSWCFRHQSGLLNALQTAEGETRKGYATIVVKAMMKELACRGEDTVTSAIDGNVVALRFYEKLGYELLENKVSWRGYAPHGVTL